MKKPEAALRILALKMSGCPQWKCHDWAASGGDGFDHVVDAAGNDDSDGRLAVKSTCPNR
jgi:hypothetical protein